MDYAFATSILDVPGLIGAISKSEIDSSFGLTSRHSHRPTWLPRLRWPPRLINFLNEGSRGVCFDDQPARAILKHGEGAGSIVGCGCDRRGDEEREKDGQLHCDFKLVNFQISSELTRPQRAPFIVKTGQEIDDIATRNGDYLAEFEHAIDRTWLDETGSSC